MSSGGYKILNKGEVHFISFAVVEWVDVFSESAENSKKSSVFKEGKRRKFLIYNKLLNYCFMVRQIFQIKLNCF